jgi:parvulin-like peptidyl-prolyl isomerase
VRNIAKVLTVICLVAAGLVLNGCDSGGSEAKDNQVAATVNGRNIMLKEVERAVTAQVGGNTSSYNQLQMAQARLQMLDSLIQREVMFQRAEREKLLPTDAQVDGAIATQKQGMTNEDFDKSLKEQNMSMETLREEARKTLAISALQDKYNGKINVSDREVEEYYANNKQQFVRGRGVGLAMIMVDPADNSGTGIKDDAKDEVAAKAKIDSIYQQLQGKADFATVARAKSEDINSLARGGDAGFATEQDLKSNNFPGALISNFFGPMQVGDYTQPVNFNGKWYIFKLAEKRLAAENVTLESVRQQIAQALTEQHKAVLNTALLETAINEAKIVNHLAAEMLSNPGNLGLRPASPNATGSQPAQAPAQSPAASPAASTATGPASTSSPVSVKPAASPK